MCACIRNTVQRMEEMESLVCSNGKLSVLCGECAGTLSVCVGACMEREEGHSQYAGPTSLHLDTHARTRAHTHTHTHTHTYIHTHTHTNRLTATLVRLVSFITQDSAHQTRTQRIQTQSQNICSLVKLVTNNCISGSRFKAWMNSTRQSTSYKHTIKRQNPHKNCVNMHCDRMTNPTVRTI